MENALKDFIDAEIERFTLIDTSIAMLEKQKSELEDSISAAGGTYDMETINKTSDQQALLFQVGRSLENAKAERLAMSRRLKEKLNTDVSFAAIAHRREVAAQLQDKIEELREAWRNVLAIAACIKAAEQSTHSEMQADVRRLEPYLPEVIQPGGFVGNPYGNFVLSYSDFISFGDGETVSSDAQKLMRGEAN